MDLTDLRNAFARLKSLTTERRALRMRLLVGRIADEIDDVLLVQSIDLVERLNDGIRGHVTCFSVREDLPLKEFVGVPIEVQLVTDTGGLRVVRGLIERVMRGDSDGAMALYQLTIVDPLHFLLKRQANTYVANDASVLEVTDELLRKLQADSPALGTTFTWTWQVDARRYPKRAFWLQKSECLTTFLMRQWRRMGISWFFRAREGDDRIELVLFDGLYQPQANAAGEVRIHHRLDATEERDSIIHWAEAEQFTAMRVGRASWDYKPTSLRETDVRALAEMSEWGWQLARGLAEVRVELPHAGNDMADFQRLTQLRVERHDFEHSCAAGISGIAALAVGACNPIKNLPGRQYEPADKRRYVFTYLHHQGESNLGELGEQAARLLQRSEQIDGWAPVPRLDRSQGDAEAGYRYLNSFVAAKLGMPLVPPWNPDTDLPRMDPMTAIVAGRDGQHVNIDELGRVQVTFPGEATQRLSAWVRLATFSAHDEAGAIFPPHVGTEVRINWEAGDESRPVIDHVYFNGRNPPPRFNNGGPLPGNKYLAGIHLHEIGSRRFGELLFDLTPKQISVQLGSEHGDSRLLLGSLYGKRYNGAGKPLGEGFYLHTNESGALRSAKSLLISAYGRPQDAGLQLDSQEHQDSLKEGLALQQDLARYAAEHQAFATEDKPQAQLLSDIQQAAGASNTDPQGTGGKPTVSITAPEGIAVSTPKALVHIAGVNIDSVAGMNMQLTSGQRMVLNAGKGVSMFAHADGIRLIANHGPLLFQSQHDSMQVDVAHDIKLTATGGRLVALAQKEIVLMLADGTFFKLSAAGIEMGSNNPLFVKTNGHNWLGPATVQGDMPKFDEGDLGRAPRLLSPTDGNPVEGMEVLLRSEEGDLAGKTGGDGKGPSLATNVLRRFKAYFFDQRS